MSDEEPRRENGVHNAVVQQQPRRKTTSFQITSVTDTRKTIATADDQDTAQEEAALSMEEISGLSSSVLSTVGPETRVLNLQTSGDFVMAAKGTVSPIIPTVGGDYGISLVTGSSDSPGVHAVDGSALVAQGIQSTQLASSNSGSQTVDISHWQGRFRVVKIESRDPYIRGRWTVVDFFDEPETSTETTVVSSQASVPSINVTIGLPATVISSDGNHEGDQCFTKQNPVSENWPTKVELGKGSDFRNPMPLTEGVISPPSSSSSGSTLSGPSMEHVSSVSSLSPAMPFLSEVCKPPVQPIPGTELQFPSHLIITSPVPTVPPLEPHQGGSAQVSSLSMAQIGLQLTGGDPISCAGGQGADLILPPNVVPPLPLATSSMIPDSVPSQAGAIPIAFIGVTADGSALGYVSPVGQQAAFTVQDVGRDAVVEVPSTSWELEESLAEVVTQPSALLVPPPQMTGTVGPGLLDCGDAGSALEEPDSPAVAIDNKIEQAMDLVKSHLLYAVREEVDVLKERIAVLEYENELLRAHLNPETLAVINQSVAQFSASTTSGVSSMAPVCSMNPSHAASLASLPQGLVSVGPPVSLQQLQSSPSTIGHS